MRKNLTEELLRNKTNQAVIEMNRTSGDSHQNQTTALPTTQSPSKDSNTESGEQGGESVINQDNPGEDNTWAQKAASGDSNSNSWAQKAVSGDYNNNSWHRRQLQK